MKKITLFVYHYDKATQLSVAKERADEIKVELEVAYGTGKVVVIALPNNEDLNVTDRKVN